MEKERGFTLIEAMLTLIVLGILAAIAVPSFKQYTANSRVSASTNGLASALALARSEALLRSTPVSVCAANVTVNPNACAADWTQGWIVFTDSGVAGTVDGADQVLQAWPPPGTTMSMDAGGSTYLQYDPRGMNTSGAVTLTIWDHTSCSGNHRSQMTVTVTGSPQMTYIGCP